jgi:formate hydrogenlyase subunit 3/multisubunit Na+/H+ antiporter MnhD subunit
MLQILLWCPLALLVLAGIAVAAFPRRWASPTIYGGSLAVCLAGAGAALDFLLSAAPAQSAWLPLGLPWMGASFRLDALAAGFLLVVNLGGAGASLYALGYGRHEPSPGRVLPFYPAFLAAMSLVVLADDAFAFLVAWEMMSLISWAMVASRPKDPENVRAAYVYLVMASFGALCLLLAFGLLAGPAGGYAFAAMRAHPPGRGIAALALILAIFGAGSKAGLVPLHAWLPLAHPAAPSHVSALMSGVMTKVAVYGFIRIVFDLLGPPEGWWAVVVLILGGASAVMGVLYALMQHDLKRLLAYHTVENIGIIFIGLGLALAFKAQGLLAAAALAVTAALFHVLNHSLFKSLLFFGSGAVQTATGERDMERLGGLIHAMPKTAFVFLIGCAAISALPPLNGFVSEWLTFQAVLLSPGLHTWGLKFLIPTVGAALALAAALAAACFVKVYGVCFLGRPRSDQAGRARETDAFSLAAMFAFAGLCVLAGVLPGFVMDALAPAVAGVVGSRLPAQADAGWLAVIPVGPARSSYDGALVLLFIIASASLAAAAIHRFASHAVRRAPAWDCGYPDPSPATQYTASSFAQPIRRVFGVLAFGAYEEVRMPEPGSLEPAAYLATVPDPIWSGLYAPLARIVGAAADRLNRLQFLSIRIYLSLVFGLLVLLLLVLAAWL